MPVSEAVTVPLLNRGPGLLYRAPLATALPAMTAAGSVFTDLWSAAASGAWVPLGATEEGTEATYDLDTEDIEAAEFLDPLDVVTVKRTVEVTFGLLSFTKSTLLAAYNAGSSAATVTGSGATMLTKISPPGIGSETNCMIGFESEDATYRAIYYNCRQVSNASKQFRKGADKTVVPFTYRCLADATLGRPFDEWLAGASRGA